jgi:hypothetical protein
MSVGRCLAWMADAAHVEARGLCLTLDAGLHLVVLPDNSQRWAQIPSLELAPAKVQRGGGVCLDLMVLCDAAFGSVLELQLALSGPSNGGWTLG